MRRSVWFTAGAGLGVYTVLRTRRIAEAFTPDGLADRLAGLAVGARMFRDEVRTGAAEAETGIRDRLGLAAPPRSPQLTATPAPHDPTATPAPHDPTATPAPHDPTATREATH